MTHTALHAANKSSLHIVGNRSRMQKLAGDLSLDSPSIAVTEDNNAVFRLFDEHLDLSILPVIDGDKPVGLIGRNNFMSQLSKQYFRELYGKKSCSAFMDTHPLIVECSLPIEALAEMAVSSGEKALSDGFILVREGLYHGTGSGLALMTALVEMQAEKNRQVMESIEYASVIQRAMLSRSKQALNNALADACVVWQPRDVVGGDFYYFEEFNGGWFAAMADCTGHGVPGAFLTLMASSSLKSELENHGPNDPAMLMGAVHRRLKATLNQHNEGSRLSSSDDGVDAAFLWYDRSAHTLVCASGNRPVYLIAPDSELPTIIPAQRQGLGYVGISNDAVWHNHHYPLLDEMLVLMVTDGLIDQIGGEHGIAFGQRRVYSALSAHRLDSAKTLCDALEAAHLAYQGDEPRRDDLSILALRIPSKPAPNLN